MQIDINSRKQLNKPENYAAFYSLLNRLPTSDRDALKESIVSSTRRDVPRVCVT